MLFLSYSKAIAIPAVKSLWYPYVLCAIMNGANSQQSATKLFYQEDDFKMRPDEMICNCKQVSYGDVADALHQLDHFDDVLKSFEEVQAITHCSTGCGG